jgi:DNA-binding winged helix-turn-helix (wHTH) protein/TolB-like protein
MTNGHSSLREFGSCRLDIRKKLLWADDRPVQLPLKAVELLCVLVEGRGQVLTKEEIWDTVWNDAFVEETNLTHNIYLLRKALNELGHKGLIETVPRRGYRFSGPVYEVPESEIVFERHSITQTVIEAVSDRDDASAVAATNGAVRNNHAKRYRYSTAVLVLLLVMIGGFAFLVYRNWTNTSDVHSIAVLPLRTINKQPGSEQEAIGLTDILITQLSGLKEITVRPATAIAPFENQQLESTELGKKLGVDAVLEGSIFRSDEGIRVTMRLVSVTDGKAIWSGEFEKPIRDELRLQDDIALKVVDALSLNLNTKERLTLTKHYTENRDAYEAYLRGRFFFDKRDETNYQKAIGEYQHAIQLDPNYALAFAGLADVYALQANNNLAESNALYEKAKLTAVKALALDDELAEAHTSLAWILRIHDWNWSDSEREFKRAIELNPNYYNAHMWYSLLLMTLDRKNESLAEIERAKELFPTNPIVLENYLAVKFYCGDSNSLVPIADQIRNLGQDNSKLSVILARTFIGTEQYQKLIETSEDFMKAGRVGSFLLASLAVAYAKAGETEKSNEILGTLEGRAKDDTESAFRLAVAYASLARKDDAIAQLQKCVDARDDRLMWIKVEPSFELLRDDPRFREMIKKMNLPS